jgi:hypothetical protein
VIVMRSVFIKALYDQRRSLLGWSAGLTLMVLLEALDRQDAGHRAVPGRLSGGDA